MSVRARLATALVTGWLTMSSVASAQQPAADSASSSKSKPKTEPHGKAAAPDGGSVNGRYQNSTYGFTYRTPFGWVDRTRQMQEEGTDPAKAQLLLAVFERPPEATGDTVNSAVIIAAESAGSYSGLKSAADYMGPLTELTTSKGFKVTRQPYEFPVGTRQLVRGDFAKNLGRLTMYQSSLAYLQKGFVVSFSFIGGSEEEVEELIEKLTFGAAARPR
jgi:hypothetical protein